MEKDELTKLLETEQRSKSNMKRLDEHDKDIDELKKTYSIMEKMDYRMSNVEKGLDSINAKLDKHDVEIQEEMNKDSNIKSKKWDKLIDYIFYFFIAAILRNNSCKNRTTVGRGKENGSSKINRKEHSKFIQSKNNIKLMCNYNNLYINI